MFGVRWLPVMALMLLAISTPVSATEVVERAAKASQQGNSSSVHRPRWGRIVTGRMGNGVRFAILPRTGSEPGIGLLMRNEGGFIAEKRPGERGLAHLIEHLFFVSPTTSAPDDLRRFIRVGLPLTFPAPSAGTTTWRETNYFLSTRTTHPADLDTLLALFREVTTDLTFRPDAVDDQRADVMREMAGRKAGNDIYARYIAAVGPGSPTDAIDAQNSDDVPTASIETIRTLYHRLYRPENMMLVIVGDVDAARTKSLIRQRFGDWKASFPTPAGQAIPAVQADRIAPVSYSDAAEGRRVAMITVASRLSAPASTRREQAQATLMEMLVVRAVNNRLNAAQPDAAPGKVGIHIENGEQGHRLIMLWDNFAAEGWRPAVAGLRQTSCDLKTNGFSEREWATARADVIRDLEQSVATMAAVPNVELAKDLSHALADGRDLFPPDELLRRARKQLPSISARAGTDWWHQRWRSGAEHIRVEAPELGQFENPHAEIRTLVDKAVLAPSCKMRAG